MHSNTVLGPPPRGVSKSTEGSFASGPIYTAWTSRLWTLLTSSFGLKGFKM